MTYKLRINGETREISAEGDMPLLWALRDDLGLVGTKYGCGIAQCGACVLHLDGLPTRACQTPIDSVGASAITTIEGVGDTAIGKRVQQAWMELDVAQCGYCQAGQIMSATALLNSNPKPSDSDIDDAMAGNLCRCATYLRIRAAIKKASGSAMAEAEKTNG